MVGLAEFDVTPPGVNVPLGLAGTKAQVRVTTGGNVWVMSFNEITVVLPGTGVGLVEQTVSVLAVMPTFGGQSPTTIWVTQVVSVMEPAQSPLSAVATNRTV
jgi:hypothetical protein